MTNPDLYAGIIITIGFLVIFMDIYTTGEGWDLGARERFPWMRWLRTRLGDHKLMILRVLVGLLGLMIITTCTGGWLRVGLLASGVLYNAYVVHRNWVILMEAEDDE